MVGYKFNYDEENFTFGLGLKGSNAGIPVSFDFAFVNFSRLDSVIRIGFGAEF